MRQIAHHSISFGIAAAFSMASAPAVSGGATRLPVQCLGSACGGSGFVTAGQAASTQVGSKLTINQTSNNATLNWQSFNISANGSVQFIQPTATSVALNNIFDSNPTQILGSLTANGRVFLINQNGIIFGGGAQVNVGGLLATTLAMNPTAASDGLTAPGSVGQAAFQAFSNGVASGAVTIDNGATLQTAQGGQVLIFAPQISNQGTISTPGGQTMLAAGNTIYLASSSDPTLRGLLVQVGGTGGTVTNGTAANSSVSSVSDLVGQISASDGNVTLAGYAVNQLGRVTATTSINENGSIYLIAGDHGSISPSGASGVSGTLQPGTGGHLVLGSMSDTEVTLDTADPSTTVDSVAQPKSTIQMRGHNIQMLNGSIARATSGTIDIAAALDTGTVTSVSDGSSFYLAPDAELDVSGASIVLPVSTNVVAVQLRGSELADSPLQQNGPLRSQTVYVDIRQGTPLADISGEIAAIGHSVIERNLTGGIVSITSNGQAILAAGSLVDMAGGEITYTGGYLDTTNLLTTTGQIVNIANASPSLLYTGIVNSTTVGDAKWGASSTYTSTPEIYSPGYVEGKDAGTLLLSAPQFVLDGNVNTRTVTGLYQRLPDQAVPAGDLYRPYNEVPQSATLVIGNPAQLGNNFVVDNVTLASELVLPTLQNPDGSAFNPLTDTLPASYTASILRPELLGAQGFGNVSIYTNGEYLQPASVALALPAGGSFAVYGAQVDIEGRINVPSGTISAISEPTLVEPAVQYGVTIGPQAVLSAAGEWINDNPLLNPSGQLAPEFINGGSVTLTAISNTNTYSPGVDLSAGSLIDVSGGGWLSSAGKLTAGGGGSINVAAQTSSSTLAGAPPQLLLDGTLRGYGLYEGGKLSVTDAAVCIAATDCGDGDPTVLWLAPQFFQSGGFSSYSVGADQGALNVAADTTVVLQQQNFILPTNFLLTASQPTLESFAQTGVLPNQIRNPVNLTLMQNMPADENSGLANTQTVTASTPSLSIGQGALIQADPLASIALESNVRIIVDGDIQAPGGDISATLTAAILESQFSATQGIWLGSQGTLDVSGVARTYQNKLGQTVGQVLGGGTVDLTAARGYIELESGSLINLSGTAATLDLAPVGSALAQPQLVASAGGNLALTTAEGIQMGGTIQAAAGTAAAGSPQPAGGSFSLTLDPSNRSDYAYSFGGISTFSQNSRQIIVSATQTDMPVAPGSAVPDSMAGTAYVSADALSAAGFDSISLKAASLPQSSGSALPGNIDFVGNVTLNSPRLLSLDAASYTVSSGAVARLNSAYVEFGNSDQLYTADVPIATAGTGTLNVSGGFIELYGTTALQNIGSASFNSSGDLRVRGLLSETSLDTTTISGGLYAAGNLEFSAQQIYPSTLTQFVISTDPNSISNPMNGSIVIQGSQGSNADLLSAGGALTLSAGTITQNGVLRAPFGSIDLIAQSITLGAGSLTSTSADGQTIPFGTTEGGLDWVYTLPNGNSVVYGADGIAPPSQHVTLQGAQVNVQTGAVIDVSGGGSLQAYEWINGTGGTNDVLSQSFRPNQYAIVPGLAANVAPYDPSISAGSTLQPGASVYLSGVPGLPAGVYQLLPARYALLPGAFLVTEVAGYQGIQAGQQFAVAGGGTIVSGYNTVAGTSFGDSITNGFDVVPASVVLQQAQYNITGANQFFANQATSGGVPAPRLPQDSGVLALIASNDLTLDGTLRTTPATGGIGGEVDISSADILVAPEATATQPGQILLTTSSLDALGAQTLLIGGLRSGNTVNTTALDVEFADGASVSAPLVLVTAQQQVAVDSGASITATGTAPGAREFQLSGDGAFLSVSAGTQNSVTRTANAGVTGVLMLSNGSTIGATGGSVYLDASNNVVTAGTLTVGGADLAVQSPDIVLGNAPSGVGGTVLGSSVLGATGLRNLLLESGSGIDVYGTLEANAQTITIDAPGLLGFGANSDVATLSATRSVTLLSSQGGVLNGAGTGSGTLQISAPTIIMGGGALTASGFSALDLTAQNSLSAQASGSLSTAGNLTVTTSAINANADVDLGLSVAGAIALLAPTNAAAPSAATGLGGALTVSGAGVTLATAIDLPSGRVTIDSVGTAGSDGSLSVLNGGSINVAGVVQQYDGVSVATPGGAVTLSATGDLSLASGSVVNVSGGAGGQGGALTLSTPGGAVSVAGTLLGGGAGASFSVDAQQLGNFSALMQTVAAGGFTGSQSVRQRGAGDLVIAAGSANTITAQTVSLEADQGNIIVDGLINASGASGGAVTLAAANNVVLNGAIDAHATGTGNSGGTVQLETSDGQMLLTAGSSINVSGGPAGTNGAGAGGTVLLRVPSATVEDLLSGGTGVALDGTIGGSSKTVLEGFTAYQNTSGVIGAADVAADAANPLYAAATTLMNSATAITQVLGQSSNTAFELEPGIEIDATTQSNGTGTLALEVPWNLYNWRFGANGNIPGVLTLRAQNGITFDASLSDGFAATSGAGAFTLPAQPSDAWSYRIAAGADLSAASPLTVNASNPADVTIAACAGSACNIGRATNMNANYAPIMVRTGDGFIDVAASGDFVLGNQQSLLYTAGVAGAGITLPGRAGSLQGLAYPTDGGNIQIDVAGDVVGAHTDQFVNAWLWRVGSQGSVASPSPTAWTVDFETFQQGVGALGGGNVSVIAGGDISNLSVSIPSIGVQVGGTTVAANQVQVTGGGNLSVQAGGSIYSGSYYVGLGSATLQAGNDVGVNTLDPSSNGLAPLIALGNASVSVSARGNLQLDEIVNPSLLNRGALQGPGGQITYFSTYGSASSVSLTAIGGDVQLLDDNSAVISLLSPSFQGGSLTDVTQSLAPLDILPPVLNVAALSGDVAVARILALYPSSSGNLQIFANNNVVGTSNASGNSAQLIVSDADPSQMPTPEAPQHSLQIFDDIVAALTQEIPDQHAAVPVFSADNADGTLVPVRVVALNGSVEFQPNLNGGAEGIWSAKPVQVVAGQNIVDLNLVAQNLSSADVTSITAGGAIDYPEVRSGNGSIAQDSNGIAVDGPGQLQITAGAGINLGTSAGVSTRANLVNPVLAASGASISMEAGMAGGSPQYAAFISTYITNSDQFDSQVIGFVESLTGANNLTAQQAQQQFAALSPQLQRTFVEQLFFKLLEIYGSKEAASGNGDYSGAFAAISALFPGANPNLAAGQVNPYSGDIDLYFSRVYTEQGGNISLLAPGGQINVGLALAPTSFGINKAPEQLGIVAQTSGNVDAFAYSDFQVNQSRVFAADGGDILVWSTDGNIDAGRGAKTSISAPALNIAYDANGQPTVTLRAAIAGSGIQALAATPGISPGNVFLFAPHGVVNADDAGIVAGNLTIAATAVLGSNNITVSGTSVGVPVTVTGVGASFAGASSAAGATANEAEGLGGAGAGSSSNTPTSDAAISWLDVFVTGLGEENCKPDDIDCLKRQASGPGAR
jgi:filamentous hemagglutinin family protein